MGGRTLDQPSLELSPKVLSVDAAHLKCGMLFTVSQGALSLYPKDGLAASCQTPGTLWEDKCDSLPKCLRLPWPATHWLRDLQTHVLNEFI